MSCQSAERDIALRQLVEQSHLDEEVLNLAAAQVVLVERALRIGGAHREEMFQRGAHRIHDVVVHVGEKVLLRVADLLLPGERGGHAVVLALDDGDAPLELVPVPGSL